MDKIVKDWHKKLSQMGNIRFASIRTFRAIYDKVAVLSIGENYFVEYPHSKIVGRDVVWRIVRSVIPSREIISGYYYERNNRQRMAQPRRALCC